MLTKINNLENAHKLLKIIKIYKTAYAISL